MRVAGLYIYPIKALGAVSLNEAELTARGLGHSGVTDRQWMLIDANNKFITQREHPKLAALACSLDAGAIVVTAPDGSSTRITQAASKNFVITAQLFKDTVPVCVAADSINDFFTAYLGAPTRLVRKADGDRMHKEEAAKGQTLADSAPLLVANSASMADLNTRLPVPVTIDRFRPSIVIETDKAWDEDTWQEISINGILIDTATPCTRCVVTTVDQTSGEKIDGEPLKTLTRFRMMRTPESTGAVFAQDGYPHASGSVKIGDTVTVTKRQSAPDFVVRAS